MDILASGCSFTALSGNGERTWAHMLPATYIAAGNGFDNGTISRLIIYNSKKLLDKNKDFGVIVQWSGVDRKSLFVDANDTVDFYDLQEKYNFIDSGQPEEDMSTDGSWAINAGKAMKAHDFWSTYFSTYYSEQGMLIQTLEYVLRTQWFLKANHIPYRMFCGWDIFGFYPSEGTYGTQFTMNGEIYSNNDHVVLAEQYVNTKYLWDLIDWDKFWTFTNDKVQVGGSSQWVQNNMNELDTDGSSLWYRSSPALGQVPDFHPTEKAWSQFTEKVISPMIGEMENEIIAYQ